MKYKQPALRCQTQNPMVHHKYFLAVFSGLIIVGQRILPKNFSKGEKANWLGAVDYRQAFAYTPDAGKATALLGNTADAYNQVWHLPTAPNPLTGKEWIEAIAKEMGVEPKFQAVPKLLVRIIGLVVPILRETVEMMYQYERDYIFDSSKFEKRFDFAPTPYLEGIRNIVRSDYA